MSFSGAPNVIHVATNGSPSGTGVDWQNAVDSISAALGKVTGHVLILVAPGLYQNSKARGFIPATDSNIRIKGAGPGTRLEDSEGIALFLVDAVNVEFEDLSLVSTATVGDGSAIQPGGGSEKQNWRVTRCFVKGMRVAVRATQVKGLIIQDSIIEARNAALWFGNEQNVQTEIYSCIASNTDFRAINPTDTDAQVILADGGELTAINCNVTAIAAFTPNSNKTYVGVQVKRGGQAVLTNVAVSVDIGQGVSSPASIHQGLDAIDTTARLRLTACSVLAKGGGANQSIVPNPGAAARMQADASLLTPAWTAV